MAIAIVPLAQKDNLSSKREGWLTMSEADELICKHLNVEPDPHSYYLGWFDNFFYFDWNQTKGLRSEDCKYAFIFNSKGLAQHHFICKQLMTSSDYVHEKVERSLKYCENIIFPIINAIYDEGYMIVSLNVG